MVLHLGGATIPDGDFWTFHVPGGATAQNHLAPRYESICFDRTLSLRSRGSELGGIGHPLVDALLKEAREPNFTGEVSHLAAGNAICARYLVQYDGEHGQIASRVLTLCGTPEGDIKVIDHVGWVLGQDVPGAEAQHFDIGKLKSRFEEFRKSVILEWIPDRQKRARVTTTPIGIHAG